MLKSLVSDTDFDIPGLLVSDASATHAFIYLADGSFSFVLDYPFAADVATASSSHRELLVALCLALESDHLSLLPGHVYWQTDSENCAHFILHGSRHPSIQEIVVRIKMLERDLHIFIHPVWTPRLHPRLLLADAGSRLAHSTDEWSIDRSVLASLFVRFGFFPDLDCFATPSNTICPRFFSLVPQPGCEAVNLFAHTVRNGHGKLYGKFTKNRLCSFVHSVGKKVP
jgi:hypothetical protein